MRQRHPVPAVSRQGVEMSDQERRELCPYCSRPLMKSRRMKFQMGEWRCAHCGAPYPGTIELDEEADEQVQASQEEVDQEQDAQEEVNQEQDAQEKVEKETIEDASLME